MTFDPAAHPREQTGKFTTKENDAPTGALTTAKPELTPKQLAIMGLGRTSVNVFAEPADAEADRGRRPFRPYLPLQPADDDELFDAPTGSIVTIVDTAEDGKTSTRIYEKDRGDFDWRELSQRGVTSDTITETGELWASLFNDDGTMRSALLSPPPGVLYSDASHYVLRTAVDRPITVEDAAERLHARRATLVSRSVFGDTRDDGIPAALQGPLTVSVDGTGYLRYQAVGRGRQASRALNLAGADIFDRDGDIVIRRELDEGYGWEEVLRVAR